MENADVFVNRLGLETDVRVSSSYCLQNHEDTQRAGALDFE